MQVVSVAALEMYPGVRMRLLCSGRVRVGQMPDLFISRQDRGEAPMIMVLLRQMLQGQKGTIRRVTASGELGRRMRDMGLVPGTAFSVRGRAPLKDPVAIQVRNFTLALRNNESDFIEVEVEEAR